MAITTWPQPRETDPANPELSWRLHDVILESVMCGDTQVNSSDLRPSIRRLTDKDVQTGKTGFETQFEVMHALITV